MVLTDFSMQHPPPWYPKKMLLPFIVTNYKKHVIYKIKLIFLRNSKMFCCYANISNLRLCRAQPWMKRTAPTPQLSSFGRVPRALKVEGKHIPFSTSLRYAAQEWICLVTVPRDMLSFILNRHFARPGFWYHWIGFRLQVYDLYAGSRNNYKLPKVLHSLLNPL